MFAIPTGGSSRKRRCLNGLRRVDLRGSRGAAARVHLGDGVADLDVGPDQGDVRDQRGRGAGHQELAFNQGFYNLFLAIVTVAGIVIGAFEYYGVGLALLFAGTGSMLAAALVLLLSSPDKARAAITQGILPLIAIVLLGAGLAM